MSRMTLRRPPGVRAPAPPKNTVHFGSVIAFSRTEAQRPKVRAWNEIRLYPSTRSATDVVFSRSRCSIGTEVSSAFVGLCIAMAWPNAGTRQKDSVPQAFFLPSTASAMARAFSFGREQTAYSSPSKNTSRSGGAAPMAVKPADSTVAQQVCRVCGGEVNPHGECVVCGTKQDAPTTTDKGLPSWLKNESGEASTWLSAPGTGDSRDEALRKWLSGEDTAFQDWIGVPTTSGGGLAARVTSDRMSDDKVRELRSKAMEVDGMRAELESMRAKLKPDQRELKKREADLVEREAALRGKEERIAAIHPDEVTGPTEELKRRLEEELREMEQDYLAKEEQFKKRIISLEGDVNRFKIEDKVRAQAQAFEGKPKTDR